jgi:hypothetical protein
MKRRQLQMSRIRPNRLAGWQLMTVGAVLLASLPALAQDAVDVTIKDHRFSPAELHVPAGQPLTINIKNEDSTPEEFESHALKIEKVIAGGATGAVRLRPLDPGSYPFVGEYNEDTAQGVIVAE